MTEPRAPASHDTRDLGGELIDRRFRVERKLGAGGMGDVWQVQHVESLQRFALKTLSPEFLEIAGAVDRFLREARAAAALRTRHVVRVVDVQMGYEHGTSPLPFIVMELLEGQTLEEISEQSGALAAGQVVWILRQVARGLEAAHGRGIVHRDLKPANVFVCLDEEGAPIVKLCDFGIAKLVGDAVGALARTSNVRTATGMLLGTPLYMSPEQLRRSGKITPATDQWAFGMIAYRLLSGQDYFERAASATELALRIAQDPMPPPSKLHAALTRAFDAWFLRSCAREARDRFPSIGAQMAALEAALRAGRVVEVTPRTTARSPGAELLPGPSSTIGVAREGFPAPAVRPGIARLPLATAASVAALVAAYLGLGPELERTLERARTERQPPATESVAAASIPPSSAPEITVAPPAAPSSRAEASSPSQRAAPILVGPPPAVRAPRSTARAAASSRQKTAPKTLPPPSTPVKPRLRAAGEPCSRSSECQSGMCLAEACQ